MSPQARRRASAEAAEVAGRRAVMARDAGLRRISSMTRRAIVGAIALSGGLAVAAANAFHGHTIVTNNTSSSSTASTQAASSGAQSSNSAGLNAPAQVPVPTPVTPVAVSGGS